MAWYDNIPGIGFATDAQTQDIHDRVVSGELRYGYWYYAIDRVRDIGLEYNSSLYDARLQEVAEGLRPPSDLAMVMVINENGTDAGTKKVRQRAYSDDPSLEWHSRYTPGVDRNVVRSSGTWVADAWQGNLAGPTAFAEDVAITDITETTATVEWTPGDINEDTRTIVWLRGVGAYAVVADVANAVTSFDLTDLTPGTPYQVTVAHYRNGILLLGYVEDDVVVHIQPVTFTTDDAAEDPGLTPPSGLVVVSRTSTRATISWTNGETVGATTIVMVGGILAANYPPEFPDDEVTVYNLTPAAYTIRIWHIVDGLKSAELTGILGESTDPPTGDPPTLAPSGFLVKTRTSTTLTIGWVPGDVRVGTTTVISVNGTSVVVLDNPATAEYRLIGLTQRTRYTVQVWHVRNGSLSAKLTGSATTLSENPDDPPIDPEDPEYPDATGFGTTGNDILEMAYARLRQVSPDEITTDAVELLKILHMALRGVFQFAARINPYFFGKAATVTFGEGGWPRPSDAESVFRIELANGTEVAVVPLEQRTSFLVADTPAVYALGQKYLTAGTASSPVSGDLSVFYSRHPILLTRLTQEIDSGWPEAFNEMLSLEVAVYIAMKDGLQGELQNLKEERDAWAGRFAAFLQHENAAMKRVWGNSYRIPAAAMSVLAGGA